MQIIADVFEIAAKMNKRTILFLCTHNAARSQMAEAFINTWFNDQYIAYSAGSEPTQVHPCAVEVMAELGIDISNQRAKSLSDFDGVQFDYVVTLCAETAENCRYSPVELLISTIRLAIQ